MAEPFQIPMVKRGEPGTLLDAERANQLIAAVNKLMSARVIIDPTALPTQSRVAMSEDNAVIIVGTKPV